MARIFHKKAYRRIAREIVNTNTYFYIGGIEFNVHCLERTLAETPAEIWKQRYEDFGRDRIEYLGEMEERDEGESSGNGSCDSNDTAVGTNSCSEVDTGSDTVVGTDSVSSGSGGDGSSSNGGSGNGIEAGPIAASFYIASAASAASTTTVTSADAYETLTPHNKITLTDNLISCEPQVVDNLTHVISQAGNSELPADSSLSVASTSDDEYYDTETHQHPISSQSRTVA